MNQYCWLTMIAYLLAGLSLSSGQNEKTLKVEKAEVEKREGLSSGELAKQGGEESLRSQFYFSLINDAIAELNGREALAWGNQMLKPESYTNDAAIFQAVSQKLGRDYAFKGTVSGGHVTYKGIKKIALKRISSSASSSAVWEMVSEKKEREELEQLLNVAESPEGAKLSELASSFKPRVIDDAIAELNGREALAWGNQMLKPESYTNDAAIFQAVSQKLGRDYAFKGTVSGGNVSYKDGEKVMLKRTASNAKSPGVWERIPEE